MHTKDTLIEDQDLEIIEHKTASSPEFEADIDPISLLQTLDTYIDILGSTPDDHDIERILSELKSMEVITLATGETQGWVSEPVILHQYILKRSMGERLRHLYKSKGEWKNKIRKKDGLEVKTRVELPLRLGVRSQQSQQHLKDRPLLLSIIGLRNTIESVLEDGVISSGVFYKPNGVVQMNKLILWIEANENHGPWPMKDDLNIKSLHDIVHEAILEEMD